MSMVYRFPHGFSAACRGMYCYCLKISARGSRLRRVLLRAAAARADEATAVMIGFSLSISSRCSVAAMAKF